MTQLSLQERFITALNREEFGQVAHHLEHMDTQKGLAAIPLVLEYLKNHEKERRARDKKYTKQKEKPIELHDLNVNLIPAALWASMLRKLNGRGVRFDDKEATQTAVDVLQLAVKTRRDDVLPHILEVVHRIRRGSHYKSGAEDGRLDNRVAVSLLGVLHRLDEHKECIREGHQKTLPKYIQHVQNEAVNRQIRIFRMH